MPDAYPAPRINLILEGLRQTRYISTLNLKHRFKTDDAPVDEGSDIGMEPRTTERAKRG